MVRRLNALRIFVDRCIDFRATGPGQLLRSQEGPEVKDERAILPGWVRRLVVLGWIHRLGGAERGWCGPAGRVSRLGLVRACQRPYKLESHARAPAPNLETGASEVTPLANPGNCQDRRLLHDLSASNGAYRLARPSYPGSSESQPVWS
jgi:hypothetical protein